MICDVQSPKSMHESVLAVIDRIRELVDTGEMTVPVQPPEAAAAYDPTKAQTFDDLMDSIVPCPPPWEFADYNGRPLTGEVVDDSPKPITTFEAFPIDAFPSGLKEYCTEVARYANADPSIPAVSLLGVSAALIGSSHRISYGSDYQPSILWGVVVVPSSECKSRALSPIVKPLSLADDRWDVKNKAAVREFNRECSLYKKHRVEWEESNTDVAFDKEPPKKPQARRIVVRGTTTEALCGIMQDNPGGVLVVKDELAELFGEMNAYSGAKGKDGAFWNASFNGESYTVDRKHAESYRLSSTTISIVGGVQPKVLESILTKNPNLTDSGLMIRPIYTMPPLLPDSCDEVFIDKEAAAKYDKLITGLLALREAATPEPITVTLSPEAKEVYKAFLTDNGTERDPMGETPMRAYCGRLRGTVLRIALVLHCTGQVEAERPTTDLVSAETMAAAVRIAQWCKYEFNRTFTALGVQPAGAKSSDPDTAAVLAVIDRLDVVTIPDIQHAHRRFRGTGGSVRVQAILEPLVLRGEIKMEVKPGDRGRPAVTFRRAR